MKIRNGFVSNSSSSSFIAFAVDKDKVPLTEDAYLKSFEKDLEWLKRFKENNPESFEKYNYNRQYERMLSFKTPEEKISYAFDNSEVDDLYGVGDFEVGGYDRDMVGLNITDAFRLFSELKVKDLKSAVAKQFNETFGTELTEDDIMYVEESWYDG